jgi:hypothetical protein
LIIAQRNATGLQQHKEEVKFFLYQNKIDILLISETHFTSKNHFNIPDYDLCFTNHPDGTAHGGESYTHKDYNRISRTTKTRGSINSGHISMC